MTSSYIQVHIGCPFYHGDDGERAVVCEGITQGSICRVRFRRKEEWAAWIEARCAEGYKDCPYYQIALLKYLD